MADTENQLDLSKSKLPVDGKKSEQEKWSRLIDKRARFLENDKSERTSIYRIRRDFYVGNHGKYTNIVGLQSKEKKGHANAVINYAGTSAKKIAYSLTNNPPNITFTVDAMYKPEDPDYKAEELRTQATEDYLDEIFRDNKFFKRGYRRAVFNQVIVGDFALKVYPVNEGTESSPEWKIKIVAQEKMENLMVGWRGDDSREFDFVIAEELRSIQSVEEEWGIKVPASAVVKDDDLVDHRESSHARNEEWGSKNVGLGGRAIVPSGKNTIPSVLVREYDDENVYAIKIGEQLVQLVIKDGKTFPKMKFWIIGENIPNPGTPWSMSDIDYLIDLNIELNEASNEERDYIRVGANQKYVAYNMNDFDPESVKTGSGGVIFVDSPNGDAKFEPLQTNVNNYPAESFLTRTKKHMHDVGVPEVTFGAAGSDSGRSKAIDYQSMVDLTVFKRDAWELALIELCEKVQHLGYFYYKYDFFVDPKTNKYKYRYPDFDWSDIVPITKSDQIVNVLNKYQMGLPLKLAIKELGYKDVDSVINMIKQESEDPILMAFRAKMFQVTPGLQEAQMQQMQSQMAMSGQVPGVPGGPDVNAQNTQPTLTSDQNDGAMPMATAGGTTSFSSPEGFIDSTRQNLNAQGK